LTSLSVVNDFDGVKNETEGDLAERVHDVSARAW
jgi:hypothetical protein